MDDRKESVEKGSVDDDAAHIEQTTSSPNTEKSEDTIERLGLEVQTKRYISALEIVSVGWTICNSWLGVIAVLQLVLYQGGPMTLLYGIILMFAMYACIVGTLAELASVYPTAGGQYHWTAILAPDSISRPLSYACGMINVFSWISINAGIVLIVAQFILAMVVFYDPTFTPKPYQYFLLYQAWNFAIIVLNCFALRKAMWLFNAALVLSILTWFVVMVTCLARAPTFQPSSFIWTTWSNETGWSTSGIVFLMGMVAPNYMYTGIDGALHMAEEAVNASTAVPRALVCTLFTGFVTAFSFSIALLYSGQDYTAILTTATYYPVYEIMKEACQSQTAATIFMVAFLIVGIMAVVGCTQTGSRLTWAFARDDALVFSKYIGRMHPKLEAPIWALFANGFVMFIIGFIYLGSSTAFQAFVGTGIILNILSFAFPAALIMARGRSERYLPKNRYFKLPGIVGWVANIFTVIWPIVGAIFYSYPTLYPVTSSNMNYASAVIGVMAIFAIINWFVWATKHYHGPKIQGL